MRWWWNAIWTTVEEPCPKCQGEGTCNQCRGTGQFQCRVCLGDGKVNCNQAVKCDRCYGYGYTEINCSLCKGYIGNAEDAQILKSEKIEV